MPLGGGRERLAVATAAQRNQIRGGVVQVVVIDVVNLERNTSDAAPGALVAIGGQHPCPGLL
jgi:hypothetical protein